MIEQQMATHFYNRYFSYIDESATNEEMISFYFVSSGYWPFSGESPSFGQVADFLEDMAMTMRDLEK